jgi:acylphosphatase
VLQREVFPSRTLGADHYRTRFMELTVNGLPELRSDADTVEVVMQGRPATKRQAFSQIFDREETFIKSLLTSGMKLPPR